MTEHDSVTKDKEYGIYIEVWLFPYASASGNSDRDVRALFKRPDVAERIARGCYVLSEGMFQDYGAIYFMCCTYVPEFESIFKEISDLILRSGGRFAEGLDREAIIDYAFAKHKKETKKARKAGLDQMHYDKWFVH